MAKTSRVGVVDRLSRLVNAGTDVSSRKVEFWTGQGYSVTVQCVEGAETLKRWKIREYPPLRE